MRRPLDVDRRRSARGRPRRLGPRSSRPRRPIGQTTTGVDRGATIPPMGTFPSVHHGKAMCRHDPRDATYSGRRTGEHRSRACDGVGRRSDGGRLRGVAARPPLRGRLRKSTGEPTPTMPPRPLPIPRDPVATRSDGGSKLTELRRGAPAVSTHSVRTGELSAESLERGTIRSDETAGSSPW